MTRSVYFVFAILISTAFAVSACEPVTKAIAPKLENLGDHERSIATSSRDAQLFFNQGLVLSFAFNHAESARAFREAQRLDPDCSMCAWGEALVLGPHVNAPMNDEDVPIAWEALERARENASTESEVNQALIDALATRYVALPVGDRSHLDLAYAEAMRSVATSFPVDADVQALFAEGMMDTMPWAYWLEDGSPKPETEEVLATLERSLDTNPNHPLALHLLIHAVEKERPELGVAAAERLGPLVPSAGHLVHMPGHIWIRVGRYHDAVLANQQAVLADDDYLAQCHAQGLYPIGYVPHNHHFLWVAAAIAGEKSTALESARQMAIHSDMMGFEGMEFLQHFVMSSVYADAMFGEWETILKTSPPPDSLAYPMGVWHFARGLAFAQTGRLADAQIEMNALRPLAADTSLGEQFGGLNTLSSILRIAVPYLDGAIASQKGNIDASVLAFEEAIRLEDSLVYDEPPPWVLFSRQALGHALLKAGRGAEAERAFRSDLEIYPENGRGLFGLIEALRMQGRVDEAESIRPRLDQAWKFAEF